MLLLFNFKCIFFCTVHWADLTWFAFHFWLYTVYCSMWQINKPWTLNLEQWKLTLCSLVIFPKGNMYSMKSNGPRTEPWGTPYCTCDRYDTSSFTATNLKWSDKFDHANTLSLMPTEFSSQFKRMLWSIVSKAELRSSSTNREIQPWSDYTSR